MLSAASHFRRVDLFHEVGPVWLLGLGGVDAKPPFEGGADLLRVEVGAPADLVDGDVSLGLPVTKRAEAGAGVLAGENDLDAVLCADELRVIW